MNLSEQVHVVAKIVRLNQDCVLFAVERYVFYYAIKYIKITLLMRFLKCIIINACHLCVVMRKMLFVKTFLYYEFCIQENNLREKHFF